MSATWTTTTCRWAGTLVAPDYLWVPFGFAVVVLSRVAHRGGRALVLGERPAAAVDNSALTAVLGSAVVHSAVESRMNRLSLRVVASNAFCADSVMSGQISGPSSFSMNCCRAL